jgi:hypothetical protein
VPEPEVRVGRKDAVALVEGHVQDVLRPAINDPRAWWEGEIEGTTDQLGGEFSYRYADKHFSRQRVTELTPGEKVTWLVVEGGPTFTEQQDEWPGTTIVFEISPAADRTEVRFTHHGLTPHLECYEACSTAWNHIITDSLFTFAAGADDARRRDQAAD